MLDRVLSGSEGAAMMAVSSFPFSITIDGLAERVKMGVRSLALAALLES